MVQGNAVELLKGIRDFASRGCRIHGNTLHLDVLGPADIDAPAFLDIAEVHRVRAPALVGDHGRFHVANERPLRLSEERMGLHIGSTGARSQTLRFVLDQEFPDEGLAQTVLAVSIKEKWQRSMDESLLRDLLRPGVLGELCFIPEDVAERRVAILALEGRRPVEHLVD